MVRCPACKEETFKRLPWSRGTPVMPAHCTSCGTSVHTSHFWFVTSVAAVGNLLCLLIALGAGRLWLYPVFAALLITWQLDFRKKQRLLVTTVGDKVVARRAL